MLQAKFIIFFLVTLLITILLYYFADRQIATYFYTLEYPQVTHFFKFITKFGQSEWVLIPSILLFWYFKKKEQQKHATMAFYIFMTNVVAGIGVWFFKIPFGRMRPEFYLRDNLYGFQWFEINPKFASFPSGHTITVISTAVAFSLLFPKWKYLFLFLGAMIAFSRVVVTKHFMSDVIFASFLGTMVAILLHQYYFKTKKL